MAEDDAPLTSLTSSPPSKVKGKAVKDSAPVTKLKNAAFDDAWDPSAKLMAGVLFWPRAESLKPCALGCQPSPDVLGSLGFSRGFF